MTEHRIAKAGKATRFKKGSKTVAEWGRKGGSNNKDNPRTKYAAKLREMKKKAAKGQFLKEDEEWFLQRLTDPDVDIFHMQQQLEGINQALGDDPEMRLKTLNSAMSIHKLKFGEKRKNENVNININLDMEVTDVDDHIKQVLGDKK